MVKQNVVVRSVILVFVVLLLTYIPLFMSQDVLNKFTKEDKIYESLSPIYLLIISIVFFIAFFRSKVNLTHWRDPAWLKRLAFLGFAGVFLLATLEEISWGQRILNIKTPEAISDVNVQKELTFHNLKIFQGEDALIPLDFDQLSAAFSLALGFLFPVACELIRPLKRFVTSRFPVLPVQFSVLFAANYIIQKTLMHVIPLFPNLYQGDVRVAVPIHEIREHDYALLLGVASVFYLLLQLDRVTQPDKATQTELGGETATNPISRPNQ